LFEQLATGFVSVLINRIDMQMSDEDFHEILAIVGFRWSF